MRHDPAHDLKAILNYRNDRFEGLESDDVYGRFGVKRVRRPHHYVPDWTRYPTEVWKVLLRSFPKLKGIDPELVRAAVRKMRRKDSQKISTAAARKKRTKNSRLSRKYADRVALWIIVINRYFDAGRTRPEIAYELGITPSAVGTLIRNILRAGDGLRTDGKGELGRPRGHRRKKVVEGNHLVESSQSVDEKPHLSICAT
jgi:hypothetical protein